MPDALLEVLELVAGPVLVVEETLVVEPPVLVVTADVKVVVPAELVAGVVVAVCVAAPPAAALDEVEVQTTVLGTLTWLAWQICWAKSMAFCWSSGLQAPTRQQLMAEMKSLLAQMHSGSRPQLPMPPFRKMLAQLCCFAGLSGFFPRYDGGWVVNGVYGVVERVNVPRRLAGLGAGRGRGWPGPGGGRV